MFDALSAQSLFFLGIAIGLGAALLLWVLYAAIVACKRPLAPAPSAPRTASAPSAAPQDGALVAVLAAAAITAMRSGDGGFTIRSIKRR